MINGLMDLDRLVCIDPAYGCRVGKPNYSETTDLGIFYRVEGGLELLKVRGGFQILQENELDHDFSLSLLKIDDFQTADELMKMTISQRRIRRRDFRANLSEFAYELRYGLREQISLEDYLRDNHRIAKAFPRPETPTHHLVGEETERAVYRALRNFPLLFGIPQDVEIYREVNLFSNTNHLITNYNLFVGFSRGKKTRSPSPISACDFVIKKQNDLWIVEVKSNNIGVNMEDKIEEATIKTMKQLETAGRFFEYNFSVKPTLVMVHFMYAESERIVYVEHYKLDNGKIVPTQLQRIGDSVRARLFPNPQIIQ